MRKLSGRCRRAATEPDGKAVASFFLMLEAQPREEESEDWHEAHGSAYEKPAMSFALDDRRCAAFASPMTAAIGGDL
jgi:hypothetical protein